MSTKQNLDKQTGLSHQSKHLNTHFNAPLTKFYAVDRNQFLKYGQNRQHIGLLSPNQTNTLNLHPIFCQGWECRNSL